MLWCVHTLVGGEVSVNSDNCDSRIFGLELHVLATGGFKCFQGVLHKVVESHCDEIFDGEQ